MLGATSAASTMAPGKASWKASASLLSLGLLFLVSGLSALVVEQVFEKLLLTVVGSATGSASIVLAVFFAGLTVGGSLYARLGGHSRRPLRILLGLELAVAGSGITLAKGFATIQGVSEGWIAQAGESPVRVFALRVLVAVLWMAIPTIAMGGTYPAMVKILGHQALPKQSAVPALFYGINLLGALLGASLGPYVFFPAFGLATTLLGACVLQAAMSLLVVLANFRFLEAEQRPRTSLPQTPPAVEPAFRGLLLLAAYSGFLVFSLEVVWYHLIGAVLGMSAYAFATMLSVVLLALFAGSSLVVLVPKHWAEAPIAIAGCLVATASAIALTSNAWPQVPSLLYDHGYMIRDFAEAEWLRFKFALGLIGVPALGAGTVYPLLLRARSLPTQDRDRAVSLLGVANALGCILGALLTGFVLVNHLGSERTLLTLTMSASVVALVVLWLPHFQSTEKTSPPLTRSVWLRTGPALLISLVALLTLIRPWLDSRWDRLALTSGIHVYFRKGHVLKDSRLLFFHEDTHSGFVTVTGWPLQGGTLRTLLTNGKFQGNDGGEVIAQSAFAALPCLFAPDRKRALVIGLGTGQSAKVIHDAGFGAVDIAEIAPGIVKAAGAEFGHLNGNILKQPNVKTILEDGRNHLLRTSHTYDLISMEISSIWFAGATNLYSLEYYHLAQAHLSPTGVLQQWIQLHHIDRREVASVLKTMRAVFPYVELWFVGGQGIILASSRPLELLGPRANAVHPAAFLNHLQKIHEHPTLGTALSLGRALSTEAVTGIFDDTNVLVNTDENRWLEFATPRHLFSSFPAEYLVSQLLTYASPAERAETTSRLKLTR